MKKLLSIILSLSVVLGLSTNALAASDENTNQIKYLPSDVEEITEEIIEEYGIVSTDENGNEIITIPIAPSDAGNFTPMSDFNPDDYATGLVHDGHTVPDSIITPYHFSLTPHTHTVIDKSSYILNTYKPVTEFADQGFTVTKEYNKAVEIHADFNLQGGISKGAVEGALGITVGGSYTRGESESYSKEVPAGYKGRIVYYYTCTVHTFVNETAYVWPNTIPQLITYEHDNCYVHGAPRNGYFGLQLISR